MNLLRWFTPIFVTLMLLGVPLLGVFFAPWNQDIDPAARTEYFLPAGFVFGIVWTTIYGGLIALSWYQAHSNHTHTPRFKASRPYLIATAALNLLWMILAASGRVVWTVPILIVMEIVAWMLYFKLRIPQRAERSSMEKMLMFPIQVYVGWLSVATIANTAAALNVLSWDGVGIDPIHWTVIMIGAGTLVAIFVGNILVFDKTYLSVFVLAYVGIAIAQAATQAVALTALLGAGVLLVFLFNSSHPYSAVATSSSPGCPSTGAHHGRP